MVLIALGCVVGVVPEAVDVDVVILVVGRYCHGCVAFLTGDNVLEEGGLVAGVVVEYDAEAVMGGAAGNGPAEGEG